MLVRAGHIGIAGMLRIILVVLMAHLSSCIVAPTSKEEPFQEGQIGTVYPGETSREEFIEIFGEPDIRRDNDSIWIYGENHTQAIWVSLFPGLAGQIKDYQFIVVEYEKTTVRNIELVEDKYGCSSTGICLRYGWRGSSLNPEFTVLASSGEADRLAKEFQAIAGSCTLYVYQKYDIGSVSVDSYHGGSFSERSYIHLLLEPGWHRLSATHGDDRDGMGAKKQFECGGGKLLFIEIVEKRGRWGVMPVFNVVNHDLGRRAIKKRNLVLFR